MNTFIVYYVAYNSENVRIEENSVVVKAYSKSEACKTASLLIKGGHSIKFSSQISGPVIS
jgi:hypothetical protein